MGEVCFVADGYCLDNYNNNKLTLKATKKCSSDIKIKHSEICFRKTSFYRIKVSFKSSCACPHHNTTLCLVNNGNILASSESVCGEGLLEYGNIFHSGSKVCLVVKSHTKIKYIKVEGKVYEDVEEYERRKQLEEDQAYDASVRIEYVPSKPNIDPACPGAPFEPQYIANGEFEIPVPPASAPGSLPSSSIVIPWKEGLPVFPPSAIFPNGQQVSTNYYRKFQSIPYILAFAAGLDFNTISTNSELLTIFLKDFQDRGTGNYAKKVYMFALICDKLPLYNTKIDNLLNTVYSRISVNNQPVVSTFRELLVKFFLDIHVGTNEHPQFVIDYFTTFIDIIGFISNPKINLDERLLFCSRLVNDVRAYLRERIINVIKTGDDNTLSFHWNEAGMPIETMFTESLHNIIAFTQYVNTFYRCVVDRFWKLTPPIPAPALSTILPPGLQPLPVTETKVPGNTSYPEYWIPASILPYNLEYANVPAPAGGPVGPVDFFEKYKNAGSEEERLNIAREAYRLLTPNGNAFSKLNDSADPNNVQVRNIWVSTMITNSPEAPFFPPGTPSVIKRAYTHYRYDTQKYAAEFETTLGTCNIPPQQPLQTLDANDFFDYSTTDNNPTYDDGTLLDKGNEKVITVFDTATFLPFGTSYRRCPAEELNYLMVEKILNRFEDLEFEFREVSPPCNPENPDTSRYVAIAPRTAVFDNLYVKQ